MRIVLLALLTSLLAIVPGAAQQPAGSDFGAHPEPVSAFGYPPVQVDQRAIVRLLKDGRFDDLERQLADLEDAAQADITSEMNLVAAYRSFYGSDASIGGRLDEWVATFPRSDAALVARAQYHDARAWTARGEDSFANDAGAVRRAREAGETDVARALDLDPDNLAAYATALRLQSTAGWSRLAAGLLDAGLERFPTSYWLRWVAARPMQPRWGGSYALMDAMAEDAQRFWTPAIIHVMAVLALAMIVAINVAWVSAGGQMWMQRYVVIVICGIFPYVAYLLFLGPKYLGRKHVAAIERASAGTDPFA